MNYKIAVWTGEVGKRKGWNKQKHLAELEKHDVRC